MEKCPRALVSSRMRPKHSCSVNRGLIRNRKGIDRSSMGIGTGQEWEKLIYVHVVRRGAGEWISGYEGATNHWYVIRQGGGDTDEGSATISPVFEDIDQLNHPGCALISTGCEVIGSSIYVIGGRDVLDAVLGCGSSLETRSNKIRCIDTLNSADGWKTCFTMPFHRSGGNSCAAVDSHGRWLYLFRGGRSDANYWGYAVNLDDENKSFPIPEPNFLKLPLPVRTPMYPPSWVIASHNDIPSPPRGFVGGYTVSEGILYIYNSEEVRLASYDLALQQERYSFDLTDLNSFGRDGFVHLIVLDAPDKLCIIRHQRGLHFTRFSVSASKSSVVVHENSIFPINCFQVLNIVTLDPRSAERARG